MSTLREAMERSNNTTVAGYLATKQAEEKKQSAIAAQREARHMRDAAILKIRSLSYTRNGKLIPRRKELRPQLERAMQAAKVYATLARPERGYPAPPFRRDEEYPGGVHLQRQKGMDIAKLSTERDNLRAWLNILVERNADVEVCNRVFLHVEWLTRRINRMQSNDRVQKRGRSFELTPAPTGKRRSVQEFVVSELRN